MFKKVAIAVVVILVAFLGYAATRPDTFRVERSLGMKAAPEKVFALVNDLHAWQGWSPWEKLDPTMSRTYGGSATGVGASYAWEGKGKTGAGRMQINESQSPSHIAIQLDFIKPFEGHSMVDFTFAPLPGGMTQVTWAMQGHSSYLAKVMHLIFNMDKMVGGDFEQGLQNMKALVEAPDHK